MCSEDCQRTVMPATGFRAGGGVGIIYLPFAKVLCCFTKYKDALSCSLRLPRHSASCLEYAACCQDKAFHLSQESAITLWCASSHVKHLLSMPVLLHHWCRTCSTLSLLMTSTWVPWRTRASTSSTAGWCWQTQTAAQTLTMHALRVWWDMNISTTGQVGGHTSTAKPCLCLT